MAFMTVRQAAMLVMDEYEAEINSWDDLQREAAEKLILAEADDLEDSMRAIFRSVGGDRGSALYLTLIRHGMRLQRKLHDPQETTKCCCGSPTEAKF